MPAGRWPVLPQQKIDKARAQPQESRATAYAWDMNTLLRRFGFLITITLFGAVAACRNSE
jgi:hypothetical protein